MVSTLRCASVLSQSAKKKICDPQGPHKRFYVGPIWASFEMGFATGFLMYPHVQAHGLQMGTIWVPSRIWPKWPMFSQPFQISDLICYSFAILEISAVSTKLQKMSNTQKCTNEVIYHRSMGDLWEIRQYSELLVIAKMCVIIRGRG